jgi:hypothetical protein
MPFEITTEPATNQNRHRSITHHCPKCGRGYVSFNPQQPVCRIIRQGMECGGIIQPGRLGTANARPPEGRGNA